MLEWTAAIDWKRGWYSEKSEGRGGVPLLSFFIRDLII
jgi:hypothetical protein